MLSFSKYIKILLVGFIFSLILSIIILSYVPPVSRDALTHHLAIPKLYLKHGGIHEIPELSFSYYPMNLDFLYIIPLSFENDILPKFIHFSFALMTAWFIFSYLKKRIDTSYALLGVILFLSLPVIIKLSITVYVDLGLYYFSTASLIYLLKWIENHFKIKYLVISAVCCGLALGTKLNGLIIFFLLTLFVPFIYLRSIHNGKSSQGRAVSYGAVFVFISLLIFSPWMIKNYIWTNNPIYPLYDSFFNSKKVVPITIKAPDIDSSDSTNNASDGVKKANGRWGSFAVRKIVYGEKWWETALIPARVFFQGQDNNPKYFDGRLNPILFIFPFFAFIRLKRDVHAIRTEKKILVLFSILFLLFVFFQTDMRIRWIGPIISPLVILSVLGLREMISLINDRYTGASGKAIKWFVIVFMTFLISLNVVYLVNQFKIVEPMSYISGRVGRDEYIEKYRPEYAVINYANQNIPENAKIMCMFIGKRSYYSDREVVFNNNIASKAVIQKDSPKRVFIDLKQKKITHILIRYDLFNKWVQDNYKGREKEVIRRFFSKHLDLLYSKNGHGLYRLKNHTVEES